MVKNVVPYRLPGSPLVAEMKMCGVECEAISGSRSHRLLAD
jgi:hypothetical protein